MVLPKSPETKPTRIIDHSNFNDAYFKAKKHLDKFDS